MTDWEQIIDEHGPLVWRTAYRMLGNETDAADCYQETFAAVLAIARRETVANWAGLLQRLAMTQALAKLRQRFKIASKLGPAVDPEMLAASDEGPSERAEAQEQIEWLRSALAELPEMQARVFWLIGIEGLSYQETAARLEIDASHAGVLLHRARGQLRNLYLLVQDSQKR